MHSYFLVFSGVFHYFASLVYDCHVFSRSRFANEALLSPTKSDVLANWVNNDAHEEPTEDDANNYWSPVCYVWGVLPSLCTKVVRFAPMRSGNGPKQVRDWIQLLTESKFGSLAHVAQARGGMCFKPLASRLNFALLDRWYIQYSA